jgi:peptidoglycan-N-acetylglucosamine deacetylase
VLSVWIWWDRFLQRRWRLQWIRPDGIFRYRLTRHRGAPVRLEDGTRVSPGDAIIELHFDNGALMRASSDAAWNPWETMTTLDADLTELASIIADGSVGPVRALYGVTLFAVPGRRLGFELHPVPHTLTWSLRRYFLIGLLPIYHHDGWREFDRMRRDRWPAELWMSISTLVKRRMRAPA